MAYTYQARLEFDFGNCTPVQALRIKRYLQQQAGAINAQINILTEARLMSPDVTVIDLKTKQDIEADKPEAVILSADRRIHFKH